VSRRRGIAAAAIVVAALGALGLALGLALGGDGGTPPLRAQAIDPPRPAPLTAGLDADGRRVRVPAQDGRPALVTFLYATCPDVCPLIADRIATALDRLGPDARRVDVFAISVDPKGDTPPVVRAFLRRHGLEGRMRYLVGTRRELAPIWRRWFVSGQPAAAGASLHSAVVYLLDRDGREVGTYSGGITVPSGDLAADLRALLA
jgi:protein SCO1